METQEVRPQRFKYVDFDLPFLLFVKDSLKDQTLKDWADAYSAGTRPLPYSPYAPATEKPGFQILGGGFPVYIPPEPLAVWYGVTLPHITVGIRFLRRVNPHRSGMILMGEVPGDRTGRASFSSVRVTFFMSTIREELYDDSRLFCELAVQALNHFISHYRVIADRPYITAITMAVIQNFEVITQFEDGQKVRMQYCTGNGPIHGIGGSISDEQDTALRSAVANTFPPSIDETLDANIRNYLDLQEWRLAIIESAVAFEAWISRHLREQLSVNGEVNIEQLFVKKSGEPLSMTSIAQKLVRQITGYDFGNTPEYDAWANKVRDLRNDIVHGKRFDVSREEALQAYNAVKEAIDIIKTSC